ncbi:MAG: hypothetical protein JNL18_18730 [Planctomycetaceae bacterium]|nr:hypothetical protein [Planctomycetaceae bacterium]
MVSQKHHWRTTDADFEKAAKQPTGALQNAVQSPTVSNGIDLSGEPAFAGKCGKSEDFVLNQCSLMDSNNETTD